MRADDQVLSYVSYQNIIDGPHLSLAYAADIALPVKNDYLETAMLAPTDGAMKTVA